MPSTRAKQRIVSGLGQHYSSPIKKRDKKKTTQRVEVPGQGYRMRKALGKIAQLMSESKPEPPLSESTPGECTSETDDIPNFHSTALDDQVMDNDPTFQPENEPQPSSHSSSQRSQRRQLPDTEATNLYAAWLDLLPSLVAPLLAYTTVSKGQPISAIGDLRSSCEREWCVTKTTSIQCLYFDRERLLVYSRNTMTYPSCRLQNY